LLFPAEEETAPIIQANDISGATVQMEINAEGVLLMRFAGRLDSQSTPELWLKTEAALKAEKPERVIIEADGINYCDGTGLGLLFQVMLTGRNRKFAVELRGLSREYEEVLNKFDPAKYPGGPLIIKRPTRIAEELGHSAANVLTDLREQVTFMGRLAAAAARFARRPSSFRWTDMFLEAEKAGVNAVWIVCLIGFLFGLIMSFSSAIPLRKFGTDLFVADVAAIGIVRILGTFITTIILIGRSGSAFAAELGTMKVNEEIDALTTMGLEPVGFLALPKVLAMILMTPLLTVLNIMCGLAGSMVVLYSLGFPFVTTFGRIQNAVGPTDVLGGLFKAVVYGLLFGACCCLRGLQAKSGPSAVGEATTRAVVTSILVIVIAEGVFSILYFCLGI